MQMRSAVVNAFQLTSPLEGITLVYKIVWMHVCANGQTTEPQSTEDMGRDNQLLCDWRRD